MESIKYVSNHLDLTFHFDHVFFLTFQLLSYFPLQWTLTVFGKLSVLLLLCVWAVLYFSVSNFESFGARSTLIPVASIRDVTRSHQFFTSIVHCMLWSSVVLQTASAASSEAANVRTFARCRVRRVRRYWY